MLGLEYIWLSILSRGFAILILISFGYMVGCKLNLGK